MPPGVASLRRHRALMHELTGGQVFDFFRGRLSSQDGIAMGLAAEACNDITMSSRLRGRMIEKPAECCRRLLSELRGQLNGHVEMLERLRVTERQDEKRFPPR